MWYVEGREALQINTAEFNKAAKKHYNALTSADKQRLYRMKLQIQHACPEPVPEPVPMSRKQLFQKIQKIVSTI